MKNYRFISGIITTIITIGIFIIEFLFVENISILTPDTKNIFQILNLILFPIIWKAIYQTFCKSFSSNKAQIKDKINFYFENDIPFILVLRPFSQDKLLEKYEDNTYDPFIGFGSKYLTIEEQISNSFSDFGFKVVGIADNKKNNIYLGYERFLADNDEWKSIVSKLIIKAKYICLVGDGNGEFQWEINEIANLDCQKKCLILYPNNKKELDLFFQTYQKLLTKKINVDFNNKYLSKKIFFGGVIYYDCIKNEFVNYYFKNPNIVLSSKLNVWSNLNLFLKNNIGYNQLVFKEINKRQYLKSLIIDFIGNLILCSPIILFPYFPDSEVLELYFGLYIYLLLIYWGVFFIFGIVPSNMMLGLKVRDKSGCPAQSLQIIKRKIVIFLAIQVPLFSIIYILTTFFLFLCKKKYYILQNEFSNTNLFQKV